MIRLAGPRDAKAIEQLAVDAIASVRYGRLRLDRARLRVSIRQALSDRRHYVAVVEHEGVVTGALAILTTDTLWAERRVAKLALWWAPQGGGMNLLKSGIRWVESRPGIAALGVEFDFEAPADDRLARLGRVLSRYGLRPTPGAFVRYR